MISILCVYLFSVLAVRNPKENNVNLKKKQFNVMENLVF